MIDRLVLLIRELFEPTAVFGLRPGRALSTKRLLDLTSSPRPTDDVRTFYDDRNPLRNDARKHTINARSI